MSVVADSLQEAFFMFWGTLWALVLGFTLSGAVQSFVSRAEMQRVMGDHRPRTIVRTGLLGAASSSCSYAASALAKSLFMRGADFTTSMVFMFASTNLVFELGIVLWLLMGWQFALAEFVGGSIMIVLFVLLAPRIFPAAELEAARGRLSTGGHEHHAAASTAPLRDRLRSKSGWTDAAGYTISDLVMLRRELVIGYVVAGFIAVAVPAAVFETIFMSGHGVATDIENVIVGPLIAFVSFVCSIGNVPLAAALYEGGISFGGTVAFVFADLLALPLVVIYAKFYGRRLAVRLFFAFWLVMSTAGLLTDLLFRGLGIAFPGRRSEIAMTSFQWDYTTFLNIAFLIVAAVVYVLYRQRDTGGAYAKDPVCGMQVERANPGAVSTHHGHTTYFCADRCKAKYDKDPSRYAGSAAVEPMEDEAHVDPVCGMTVDPTAAPHVSYAGQEHFFCSTGCATSFAEAPLQHLKQARDPVCGMTVTVAEPGATATVGEVDYVFCCQGCADKLVGDPGRYLPGVAPR
jgi:YHS domain-containing protein/uncharacterized membrane protein YraQ (UPF0718 family)